MTGSIMTPTVVDGEAIRRWAGCAGTAGSSATTTWVRGPPREVDVLKGANMSYRRQRHQGIGFDERLRGAGAQVHFEVALGLAVKRAGWRLIYDPAVAVDHYPAQRFDDDERAGRPCRRCRTPFTTRRTRCSDGCPGGVSHSRFAYGLGVGTRMAPGLIVAAERWFRESDRER